MSITPQHMMNNK